jgi:hypothetical protein
MVWLRTVAVMILVGTLTIDWTKEGVARRHQSSSMHVWHVVVSLSELGHWKRAGLEKDH